MKSYVQHEGKSNIGLAAWPESFSVVYRVEGFSQGHSRERELASSSLLIHCIRSVRSTIIAQLCTWHRDSFFVAAAVVVAEPRARCGRAQSP